ncbi:MAG: hypothetical protein FWH40_04375 [Coriobacteriia bacterium]|nr:hypothetical protein [Coriobacteriia bacterium]
MRVKTKMVSLIVALAMLGQLAGLAFGEVEPTGAGGAQTAPLAAEEAVPQFRLTISIPSGGATFVLPTSGNLGGTIAGKPFNWAIDWGDGSTEASSGTSEFNSGIAHTYAGTGDYTVTIEPAGSTEAWLAAFGFAGAEYFGSKAMLTGVLDPLRPEMTRTQAQIDGSLAPPNNEWNRAFFDCQNLTTIPTFEGWEAIGSVGDNFASEMFFGCYRLTTLPEGFNLPQSLTEVGDNFASFMFANCINLKTLSSGFNLPQGLTEVGNRFATGLFSSCGGIEALPAGFNLPQGLTRVGDYFAHAMFFYCTRLATLPIGFNLPQGITETGNWFAGDLFYYCINLTNLPEDFNLPPGITSVGSAFGCAMFFRCLRLELLPDGFNLPQGITETGELFAASMFHGAGSPHFQINDGFCLPVGVPAETEYAFSGAFILSDNAPVQNRTAASIIGDCPTPSTDRRAFGEHFTDIDDIDANWSGRQVPPPIGEPGSGDLNGDGSVTMDEVIIVLRATIGSVPLSREQLAVIDMDFDGEITMGDVILALQKTV